MNRNLAVCPLVSASVVFAVLVGSMASFGPAQAQMVSFMDKKNGERQPISDKCFTTDKCDSKWLSTEYDLFEGKKLRIAITRKSEQVQSAASEWSVSGVEDLLVQALLQTHRIVVVENASGSSRVDYVIGVSVNGAGSEHRNMGGLAGKVIGGGLGIGSLGVNKNKSKLAMTFRMINPKTDEVEIAETVEGSCSVSGLSLGALGVGSGGGGAGGTSGWKSPSLAAAAQVCANKIAYRIAQKSAGSE